MLIHIIPRLACGNSASKCELIDVVVPELGLTLLGDKHLTVRKPYPNKTYLVACRKIGRGAVNGILINTEQQAKVFTSVTRWCIDDTREITHRVVYVVEDSDSDFDMVSEQMILWGAHCSSLGGWESRYPKGVTYGSPMASQPSMELAPGGFRRPGSVNDMLDDEGNISKRLEIFIMPTIERDRYLGSNVFAIPKLADAFHV